MNPEGITVVVTNYNKGKFLLRSIDSVIQQIRENDEIVMVDDASENEEDYEIIKQLKEESKKVKIRVIINDKNMGVSFSKNRGVGEARNDVIVLLDGDDTLPINAIDIIREQFSTRKLDVLFGDYLRLEGRLEKRVYCNSISKNMVLDANALARNWILLGTSPFRKSSCFEGFKFNSNFNRTDDVDFHRQLIISGKRIGYVDKVIYHWHHFTGGNNDSIPSEDILYSHASGLSFYRENLNGLDYVKFMLKFCFRLLVLSIKRT